jgi:hypothetical protein
LHSRPSFDTGIDWVNVVNSFLDQKYRYMCYRDHIEYLIGSNSYNVEFGIPSRIIKQIVVYEMTKTVVLIIIHTNDGQVYLSGHSATSTSPIFVKQQITTHLSVGQQNSFESIEFDPSNSLQFQVNMTRWTKFFSINELDGSIRQL